MFYRLLGPVEAVRDGRPVELGGPKQRAVLAVLLLEAGRVVSTDRLVQAVWGDDQPPSVLGSLQVNISNLRRLLRDDEHAISPIVRQPPGYLINVSAADLDLTLFEAHCDAAQAAVDSADWVAAVAAAEGGLELWRGPLLSEHDEQDWVRIAATALDDRRAGITLNLITGLLGLGRVTPALAAAGRLHAEEPLREHACWLHMISLYRAGRSADALEIFRIHAQRMDDDLGLGAGPALRDLQGAILRQEPHLDSWPVPSPEVATPGVVEPQIVTPQPVTPVATPDGGSSIVGRGREIELIETVLIEARHQGSRWIALTGAAGIGKTRLAEEAVTRWQRTGGAVSRTRCPDDDVPPWWPLRQLLRDLGHDPDDILVPPSDANADAARFQIYDRVLTLLSAATRAQPLLLLVDDVHWADSTSLRFFTYLSESHHQAGLAVVTTVREGEGGEPVARLLAALARNSGSRQLSLPPLSAAEVRELADRVSGQTFGAAEAADLATRTGGNPFFVSEYARLPEDERRDGEVPMAVRSVLGRRLAGLDPAVLQVMRAAALIGDVLDVDLLASVTRLDRDELADLLDEAADDRIIVPAEGSGAYRFAHALLRDEVVAGMPALRRQRLHLRIAQTFGTAGGSDQLVRRASHLMSALPLAEASEAFAACKAAAFDAEERWQSEAAAHWWGNALVAYDLLPAVDDEDRDELVIARVAALARAGRGQTVLDAVDAALLDAVRRGRLGSAGRLAATLLRASGSWPWVAHGSDPGPLLARLAGVEPLVHSDPAAHVRILATLAVGSYYDPEPGLVDRLSGRALALAEQQGDPEVIADALLGRALGFSAVATRARESIELLDRLVALPHRLLPMDEVLRHSLLSMARLTIGEPEACAEHIRLGAVGSDLLRLPVSRVQLRWMEGTLALWYGDFDRASELYEHARDIHRQTELYQLGSYDMATLSLRWQQRRLAELDAGSIDPASIPWASAVITAARDDPAADALIAAELARDEPVVWTTHGRLTALAHAVADRGLRRHASALRARLEPFAEFVANIGQVGVVGPVALALARLCALDGDLPAARGYLVTAMQLSLRAKGKGAQARCQAFAAELAEEGS